MSLQQAAASTDISSSSIFSRLFRRRKSLQSAAPNSRDFEWAKFFPGGKVNQVAETFAVERVVGQGAYGTVYEAHTKTKPTKHVALKVMKSNSEDEGMNVSAMREVALLQTVDHPNVIKLHNVYVEGTTTTLVFEFAHFDLVSVMKRIKTMKHQEQIDAITCLMWDMLTGLSYLHQHHIVHRDIKPANILLCSQGVAKLADFGLGKNMDVGNHNSHTIDVVTLWYRPPEVIMGEGHCHSSIDIWSLGCILVELFEGKVCFKGKTTREQLEIIFSRLGTPTVEEWPGLAELPTFKLSKSLPSFPKPAPETEFSALAKAPEMLKLALQMIVYDPDGRITAGNALKHAAFERIESGELNVRTTLTKLVLAGNSS